MSIETMKLALEALKKNYTLINGDGSTLGLEGATDGYYRKCFDIEGANKETKQAITSLRKAIAEAEKQTRPWFTIDELNAWADEYESKEWRNAALRLGEELSSVGPNDYYDMRAKDWLDWAMQQLKEGKEHMSTEAMKMALEALELMYACYAHPDWISHRRQEEKILAQCVATTMTLRKAIQEEALRNVQRIGQEIEQEPVGRFAKFTDGIWREVTDGSPGQPLYAAPQPKQEQGEPVAWIEHHKGGDNLVWDKPNKGTPLYTHPQPKREPLTRDDLWKLWCTAKHESEYMYWLEFARAIEAAHGIKKNYTHPQPITTCSGCGESSTEDGFLATYCLKCVEVVSGKPLTDEQIETLWHEDTSCDMPDELKQFKHTARAIEAAHGIKENKCDCADKSQCWEPCGELGKSGAHTEVFDFQQTLKPNDGVKT
jgi:hypothetical protein